MTMPTPRRSPAKRGLYAMAKLPAEPRAQVAAFRRTSRLRHPDLLHTTLLAFVDLDEWPAEFLALLLERMEGFQADAFYMSFDHISERGAVTLRSSKPQWGVRKFRKSLVNHLIEHNFPFFVVPGEAHVTIRYDRDGMGDEPIDPISWRVDEVLLIESLGGKSTHLVRGRWQLSPLLV